ncbi:MAG: FIST signal transduction protein [Pseudomonadota bacterium]
MRSALSRAAHWRDAVEDCLRQIGPCGDANLGFVYFSDHFADDAQRLLDHLRTRSSVANWTGSVAYGVCGMGQASVDEPALSLLVGRFPDHSFHVFSGRDPLRASDHAHFALVHGDPQTPDMSELVADMAGKVSSGFVSGGLTSGRGTPWQVANDLLSGGISGVAFSHEVGVASRLTQGCSPVAGPFPITQCEDNVVARLGGRPALEVYLEAAGNPPLGDLRRVAATLLVGLQLPGDDPHDYLVRHVIGIDPHNGLLAVSERVETGQSMLLCRRDADAARRDMLRMLAGLKQSLAAPPQGGIYVCCTGRGGALFGNDNAEMQMIRATLGEMPIAGFFAAGEIAHDRLYGYTGVLTLFT